MLTTAVNKLDCSASIVTPENIEFQYALAGPFQRLPAFLFDLVVRIAIFVLLVVVITFIFSWVSLGLLAMITSGLILYFLLDWFYGAYFESRFNGRTLGKMVFRLRVISVDGRPINAVQAVLRNVLRMADMGVYISLQTFDGETPWFGIPTLSVGLLVMALTSRYQRLGDLAAGTIVISEHGQRTPWNLPPDDVRAFGLAELIPGSYPISTSLAQTVGMYMENRQRLYPARRTEIAKHLAAPLIRKFDMLPDTSYDLFMCALYVRIFFSAEQRARGLEELRRRQPAIVRASLPQGAAPGSLATAKSAAGSRPGEALSSAVAPPPPTVQPQRTQGERASEQTAAVAEPVAVDRVSQPQAPRQENAGGDHG